MQFAGCSRDNARWSAGNMPKKKLNLLQFTACGAAKPSAASTEIVRGEFAYANLTGELLDDVPDQLLRDSLTPNLAGAAHTPKEAASFDSSRSRPVVEQADHPVWHGNGANMTRLPRRSTIAQCPSRC